MANANRYAFSRKELADIYEKLVLSHELAGGYESVKFNSRNKKFRKLVKDIELDFKRFKTINELNKVLQHEKQKPEAMTKNICWFLDSQQNSIKSVLKLLRNSAAHAHIMRTKTNVIWYSMEHQYRKQTKFRLQMKATDFWKFVEQAKNSK